MVTETRPLYLIGSELDSIVDMLSQVSKSVNYVATNIDESFVFPDTASIMKSIHETIIDSKNTLSRLENVLSKLKQMEGTSNANGTRSLHGMPSVSRNDFKKCLPE